jgi:hypothetical protein
VPAAQDAQEDAPLAFEYRPCGQTAQVDAAAAAAYAPKPHA